MKLTPNFSFKEFTDWGKFHNMTASDTKLLTSFITEDLKVNEKLRKASAKKIAVELEVIRTKIRAAYPDYDIGIRILSGLRPKAWELYRGRSGTSRHTIGDVADWDVIAKGLPVEKRNEIMAWIFKELSGWNGGLAVKYSGNRISFIHIDLGRKRRWTY